MIRDNYLNIDKITQDKKIFRLFRTVEKHGGILRFVGGSVRDALAGIGGFDLDLATDLSPEELAEACAENGFKTVPIGIKFGTLGVIINDAVLEITSLRRDVKTDGRHAEVEFTSDWKIDASRRDLTINAVYADDKGNVFDYYNGIDDLEKGVVRFIGSPSQRIKEDYLRILRFFRFHSIFAKTPVDEKALAACIENKDGLKSISLERIRDELFKIILTPNAGKTLKIMSDNDILSSVLPSMKNFKKLDFMMHEVETEKTGKDALRRLFVLFEPNEALAENLAVRLKFTKKQRQSFVDWARIDAGFEDYEDENKLAKLVYNTDKDFAVDKLIIMLALNNKSMADFEQKVDFIQNMVMPIFPIRGKDVLNVCSDNREIGFLLNKLEKHWIESNFQLTREELLNLVPKLKTA